MCHAREGYAAIAEVLELLRDYAVDAWAACRPRDDESGLMPAEGEPTP